MEEKKHWENIYSESLPEEVSWYQDQPTTSLRLIEATGVDKAERIIDVGGGASNLADHLLDRGFSKLAVLDISLRALERAKLRLGTRANKIEWIESDLRTFKSEYLFTLWHDRAVLHFLTKEQDRQSYLRILQATLAPRGHVIIATFAVGGPKQCSGIDIVQYDPDLLRHFLGNAFELKETVDEVHQTPWNSEQKFVYCRFQLR